MILIGGTNLVQEELPYSNLMEYTLEGNPSILAIKLKTVAKSSACLGVYLHNDLSNLELMEDVASKTNYFTDDAHLLKLLDNSTDDNVVDTLEEDLQAKEEDNVQVFDTPTPQPKEEEEKVKISVDVPFKGVLELEEVDTELPDTLLSIPNIGDDVGSLHQVLETKDKIIEQKDGIILDMTTQLNDSYKLQEIQLLEMKATFEQRIDEANKIIDELNSKVSESAVPEDLQSFLKYATYSKKYKSALREGFTENELKTIGRKTSPVYIFASASGESVHSMLKNVKALIDKKTDAIVVDFTGDIFFEARYRWRTRDSSMLLNDPNVSVQELVKEVGGTKVIPTTFYNDIALLDLDWATLMKKLMVYASGKPIILLFNSINSFSVKYTVSKLATLGELFIFAKSNPVVLSTLLGELKFIPEDRLKVVAIEYIDIVKQIVEEFAKTYSVTTFKEAVVWSKIGVKV